MGGEKRFGEESWVSKEASLNIHYAILKSGEGRCEMELKLAVIIKKEVRARSSRRERTVKKRKSGDVKKKSQIGILKPRKQPRGSKKQITLGITRVRKRMRQGKEGKHTIRGVTREKWG